MAGWILSVAPVWAIKRQRSTYVFERIRGEGIYLIPQEENY